MSQYFQRILLSSNLYNFSFSIHLSSLLVTILHFTLNFPRLYIHTYTIHRNSLTFTYIGQVIDPSVTSFFMNVVSQMVKEREDKAMKRHDFMDLLIELKNKGTLELDNGNGLRAQNDDGVTATEEIGKFYSILK